MTPLTPARLAGLIKIWKAEAAIARRCERRDEYAVLCQETVGALRELERLMQPKVYGCPVCKQNGCECRA